MRYYSTQRPIVPGSYPRPAGNSVTEIQNFDSRIFCEEIDREAWGYICYQQPLAQEQQAAYEFVAGDADWEKWAGDETSSILSAPSVHESGQLLETFIAAIETVDRSTQSIALGVFWETLRETSFINEDGDVASSNGWAVCPPERAVATYLSLELKQQESVAEDIDCIKRCAQQFMEQFEPSDSCGVETELFTQVMEYLDKKYHLNQSLFQNQKMVAIFLEEKFQDGPIMTFFQYKNKDHKITSYLVFMDASGFASLFLNLSPAFYVFDSIATIITITAFCTTSNEKGKSANELSFPKEVLDWLDISEDCSIKKQKEKVKRAIRDTLLAESPFVDETARNVLRRSGVPERKKVLEVALNRLTK